jgi:hypothetical protein
MIAELTCVYAGAEGTQRRREHAEMWPTALRRTATYLVWVAG